MPTNDPNGFQALRSCMGHGLQRPAVSPDGKLIAVISPSFEIHILRLRANGCGIKLVKRMVLLKATHGFLERAHILKWSRESMTHDSPEVSSNYATSEHALDISWLLLSDCNRIITLTLELAQGESLNDRLPAEESAADVVADIDIGSQYGKITLVDFVFSHRYILILFEMNTHASIISLTKLQRDDIPAAKFPDSRAFSQSFQGRYFALLSRSKGQDQVSVFSLSGDGEIESHVFNPRTSDAQGVFWSPNPDPLLLVWDSASYGFKVSFFTAHGHNLSLLEMDSMILNRKLSEHNLEELGILHLEWLRREDKTLLAIASGTKTALICDQSHKARTPILLSMFVHQSIIDPLSYPVWQESPDGERLFTKPTTSLEAALTSSMNGVERIAINANSTMVATKDATRPKILWIWHMSSSQPRAIINFRENLKQILWHPTAPSTLVVITAQNESNFYVWHEADQMPSIGRVSLSTNHKRFGGLEGTWVPGEFNNRSLFLISTPDAFNLGYLNITASRVVLDSIFDYDALQEEVL